MESVFVGGRQLQQKQSAASTSFTDVLESFKNIKGFAETLTGSKLEWLRSDSGTEYVTRDMKQFRIEHETSVYRIIRNRMV